MEHRKLQVLVDLDAVGCLLRSSCDVSYARGVSCYALRGSSSNPIFYQANGDTSRRKMIFLPLLQGDFFQVPGSWAVSDFWTSQASQIE